MAANIGKSMALRQVAATNEAAEEMYLQKREGTYYTRLVVPARFRGIIGKSDLGRSLKTKDRNEAKRLLPEWLAEAQAIIADAEEELAGRENSAQAARREGRKPDVERLRRKIRGSTAAMPSHYAAIRDLLREEEEEHAFALARASAPVLPPVVNAPPAFLDSPAKAEPITIVRMFNGYANQPGSNPSTVNQFRSIMDNLIAFLGHNDAVRVSHADLVRWLEHLRTEIVKRGPAKGKARSATTINESYLAAIKAVFAYGRQALLIDSNPAAEVKKVRAPKKPKLREKDFTKAERRAILKAALVPAAGNLSDGRKLARRWVPWLCAYTGARVNEMTQLRAEDVQNAEGHWTIRITPEAGRQKTKEARTVPLHEHLIEQGFLAAVEGKQGPLFYDPALDRGGTVKPQSVKVGQFLATWVRTTVGVSDQDVQPNHAWRHTFKTVCREAGIEEQASDAISGHTPKSIGRKYGSYSIPALAMQLEKFPRYELELGSN